MTHKHLYKTRRWRLGRLAHLRRHPLCARCLSRDLVVPASVVHHVVPHRGDEELFFDERNWESACAECHDREEQSEEARGFSTRVGTDGWPVDPRHAVNGGSPRRRRRYGVPDIARPTLADVVLVCGPPASGKTTWARRSIAPGDVIVDLDDIMAEMGFPRWTEDRRQLSAALRRRDLAVADLARLPAGRKAYVVAGAPEREAREEWLDALGGGEAIILRTSRIVCVRRVRAERHGAAVRLMNAINEWFERFTE